MSCAFVAYFSNLAPVGPGEVGGCCRGILTRCAAYANSLARKKAGESDAGAPPSQSSIRRGESMPATRKRWWQSGCKAVQFIRYQPGRPDRHALAPRTAAAASGKTGTGGSGMNPFGFEESVQ
jgi:hypothetical protein